MRAGVRVSIIALGVLGSAYAVWHLLPSSGTGTERVAAAARKAPAALVTETKHYAITSTASASHTKRVAAAVESLHGAYTTFFSDVPGIRQERTKLKLVLYRDRQEFQANNHSSPWAEAYYRPPTSYAYYAEGYPNPYHWMVHEATHQLNREVAGFKRVQWIDEGLASYFGSSQIEQGALRPGSIDADTYPIWWLRSLALSGDLQEDIARRRIIPLRALVSGTGPPIAQHVNLYYIEFWSLTHFLFHYENGRYADRYRELIAKDASLESFEATIGPIDRIQAQWYGYLRERITEVNAGTSVGAPKRPAR